jgi:transcriptional regulator NrdR family protein
MGAKMKLNTPTDAQERLIEALNACVKATPAQRRQMQELVLNLCSTLQMIYFTSLVLDDGGTFTHEAIKRLNEESLVDFRELWLAFENFSDFIKRPSLKNGIRNPNSPWKT